MTSSNAALASESGQGLLVTLSADSEQMQAAGPLSLRCGDVHPVGCDAAWSSPSVANLVAKAIAHGACAHGFTPAWYAHKRLARIEQAARGS